MTLEKLLNEPVAPWMAHSVEDGDIVLSSRVRLARNFADIPFPNRADTGHLRDVVEKVKGSLNDIIQHTQCSYLFVDLTELSAVERNLLVEKHIISPHLIQTPENRALVVRDDATVSIMVNEEDHMRIQCLRPGLNLSEALSIANDLDDIIEQKNGVAFNEQIGYLTACPTNIGTGLRASVMLHLPALVLTQQINRIFNAASQLGLTIRGLYGEGTEAAGNIFQISNQLTLGHNEQEIIDNLQGVVKQVVDHERTSRTLLMNQAGFNLEDRVWRAYGILRYVRSITAQEALSLLSEVRLGIDLGLIDECPAQVFDQLIIQTRPNYILKLVGKTELTAGEQARLRGQIIRNVFDKLTFKK